MIIVHPIGVMSSPYFYELPLPSSFGSSFSHLVFVMHPKLLIRPIIVAKESLVRGVGLHPYMNSDFPPYLRISSFSGLGVVRHHAQIPKYKHRPLSVFAQETFTCAFRERCFRRPPHSLSLSLSVYSTHCSNQAVQLPDSYLHSRK